MTLTEIGPADRLMLLDTASLYFRAFYGVPDSVTAPDGTPVNAVRGLLDFIARLTLDRPPTELVACWDDDWRPEFRVAAIPSYKAHRVDNSIGAESDRRIDLGSDVEEIPDTLAPQIPIIVAVLAALGIARVGSPGYEADDVIGTLTAQSCGPVDVVTGDRDLFQLVDDSRPVVVLYTARGVGRRDLVDEAWVSAKYAIPGRAYADFATLRGDPSDGLPGVVGVGDKTAATLITTYGSLAAVRAAALDPTSDLKAAIRTKLVASSDYLDVAPRVVQVAPDAPLPHVDMTLPSSAANDDALQFLAERWGLTSSIKRVQVAFAQASS